MLLCGLFSFSGKNTMNIKAVFSLLSKLCGGLALGIHWGIVAAAQDPCLSVPVIELELVEPAACCTKSIYESSADWNLLSCYPGRRP